MTNRFPNKHTDTIKFVHITDTHLLDRAEENFHSLNTKESLEAVLSHSQSNYPDVDFLLITGDISQTGNKESYSLFSSVIQQHALPIYCVPGNHDTPDLLKKVVPECPDETISIIQLGKFSLVLLNSWVEDKHHGMLTLDCLHQLNEHLENSIDQFNIIAIHHPPVPVNSPWLDEIALQNQTDFLQIINRHTQNTLVLFGHVHQEFDQQLGSMRMLATPSTCHQFQANSERMQCASTLTPAYRYVALNSNELIRTNNIVTKVHYIEWH